MNETTITITLELEVDGDSLCGRATDEAGAATDFAGWLGLVATIDALVVRELADAPEKKHEQPRRVSPAR